MKPVDVKFCAYIDFGINNNNEDHKYIWVWQPQLYINPIMGIVWIDTFWGVGFDLLKGMELGNLVGLLSISRWLNKTYQGWFMRNFAEGISRDKLPDDQ